MCIKPIARASDLVECTYIGALTSVELVDRGWGFLGLDQIGGSSYWSRPRNPHQSRQQMKTPLEYFYLNGENLVSKGFIAPQMGVEFGFR